MKSDTDKRAGSDARLVKASALIAAGRLHQAFDELRSVAADDADLLRRIDTAEAEYFYFLRFLSSTSDAKGLGNDLARMKSGAEVLLERTRRALEAKNGTTLFSSQLRFAALRPEETLESLLSDYLAETDRLATDTAALTDTRRRAGIERMASDIFNRIWIEFDLPESTSALLDSIIGDDSIPFYDRMLWINAMGLNMLRSSAAIYRPVLLHAAAASDARISTLAVTWLLIVLEAVDNDASLLLELEEGHSDDIADVVLEWCRTLGTRQLTQDIKGSIEPGLRKMGRHFTEKIQQADPEKMEELMRDAEWLTDGLDSESYDTMKRFAEAQRKGDDVFMATLGNLRHFDFFRNMSNWFLPFHTAHSSLAPVVDSESVALADAVTSLPALCDSDKYALLLSVASTPEQMRSAAFAQMSQQMQQMLDNPDMAEAMGSTSSPSRHQLIGNAIKNIYRFFNLFQARAEFVNPLYDAPAFILNNGPLLEQPDRLLDIAETLFRLKCYSEAADCYRRLAESSSQSSLGNASLRKYAFALEISGRRREAAAIYRSMPDDIWASRRAADCLVALGDVRAALAALAPFEESAQTETPFLLQLARVYGLSNKWSEAAAVLHRADYNAADGDSAAIKTSLARAYAMQGDYDMTLDFLSSLSDDVKPARLNAALLWLAGRRAEALRSIAAVLSPEELDTLDETTFLSGDDAVLLSRAGVSEALGTMLEAARYLKSGSRYGSIV